MEDLELKFKELLDKMGNHAQAEYPKEACGIVTTEWDYVPCKNRHPDPKNNFILDPLALLEHEDDVWGVFHSHPGAENPLPSESDVRHTVFNEFKFIVGFAGKFYIYWYDFDLEALRYEPFAIHHLNDSQNQIS